MTITCFPGLLTQIYKTVDFTFSWIILWNLNFSVLLSLRRMWNENEFSHIATKWHNHKTTFAYLNFNVMSPLREVCLIDRNIIGNIGWKILNWILTMILRITIHSWLPTVLMIYLIQEAGYYKDVSPPARTIIIHLSYRWRSGISFRTAGSRITVHLQGFHK